MLRSPTSQRAPSGWLLASRSCRIITLHFEVRFVWTNLVEFLCVFELVVYFWLVIASRWRWNAFRVDVPKQINQCKRFNIKAYLDDCCLSLEFASSSTLALSPRWTWSNPYCQTKACLAFQVPLRVGELQEHRDLGPFSGLLDLCVLCYWISVSVCCSRNSVNSV